MARLISGDESQLVTFNEGPLASSEQLLSYFGHRRARVEAEAQLRDEGPRQAWLLARHAAELGGLRRSADGGPLDVWILERGPGDGALDAWFTGMAASYRVMLYQSTAPKSSPRARYCWDRVNDRIHLKRRRRPPQSLTQPVIDLLERVRSAYSADGSSVESIIESTSHPYHYATTASLR